MTHHFENGMTVREFKKIVAEWPDDDESEVWITTPGTSLTNVVTDVVKLNKSDMLLEAGW